MSAIGHKLEERGFSTVVLAGSRTQAQKTRPPRALWNAGLLGRPVAEPDDPAFQTRLIKAALALLERADGPVILEDFPDDPPSLRDNPDWVAPDTKAAVFATPAEWRAAFEAERAALMPLWQSARTRFGRTSTGLSFLAPEAWAGLAADVLGGGLPVTPELDTTALSVRFLCDDIKAFYGEAAQAVGAKPSAMQLDRWFWRHTVAGGLLRALRVAAIESPNNALKTVGGRFFVPTPWVVT